jgi:hypothetical protein
MSSNDAVDFLCPGVRTIELCNGPGNLCDALAVVGVCIRRTNVPYLIIRQGTYAYTGLHCLEITDVTAVVERLVADVAHCHPPPRAL